MDENIPDKTNMIQIELDDIQDEVAYWQSSVICYILGANPPQNVMSDFVHRIWGKYGIDKVSLVGKRVFLIRFKTMENF